MADRVAQQLADAREKLLDLSMRNRLLNFRPTKRTTIRVVDELPHQTWRLLYVEGKALEFLAREEHELVGAQAPAAPKAPDGEAPAAAPEEDLDAFALPELQSPASGGETAKRYRDLYLQTALTGPALQMNLLRIYQAANSALDERGVNLLFLAVGFLSWRQEEYGDQEFKAPIFLVPVQLERTSAQRRFKLRALDDDPVLNPCLYRKLRDLRIAMPGEPEDWEAFDIGAYITGLEKAIAGQPGWSVLPEITLGLFSFTKYLMYLDLDPARWPEGDPERPGLLSNPVIRAVAGEPPASADGIDLPDPRELDDVCDPAEVFHVLDADSSQHEAILAVKKGRSLVIEGPPGTGKSQTIANIIAECLAAGKTVLFVSQKMAALDVVKRRLERVGLADMVLEIHSTKANRSALLAELNRILSRQKDRAPDGDDRAASRLRETRKHLNDYVRALHEPWPAPTAAAGASSGMTPFEAMGRSVLLRDVPEAPCDIPGCETWDGARVQQMKDLADALSRQMLVVGWPAPHAWTGSRLTSLSPRAQRDAGDLLTRLIATLRELRGDSSVAARELDAAAPATLASARAMLDAARLVESPPPVPLRLLTEPLWDALPAEVRALMDKLEEYAGIREWMKDKYAAPAADALDCVAIEARYATYGSILYWLRPSFWRDRKAVRRALESGYRPGHRQVQSDLKSLARRQQLRAEIEAAREMGGRYFDALWNGTESDVRAIRETADWLLDYRRLRRAGVIGPGGEPLALRQSDPAALVAVAKKLAAEVDAWDKDWSSPQRHGAASGPRRVRRRVRRGRAGGARRAHRRDARAGRGSARLVPVSGGPAGGGEFAARGLSRGGAEAKRPARSASRGDGEAVSAPLA